MNKQGIAAPAGVFDPSKFITPEDVAAVADAVRSEMQAAVVEPKSTVEIPGTEPSEAGVAGESRYCPVCGTDIEAFRGPKVTDRDKNMWLRYVLGETRFRREYVVLGGNMTVRFRTKLASEHDQIMRQVGIDSRSEGLDDFMKAARLARYTMLVSLDAVTKSGVTTTYPEVNSANYKSDNGDCPVRLAYDSIIGSSGEGFVSVLMREYAGFESLVARLSAASEDENFWRPTEEGR